MEQQRSGTGSNFFEANSAIVSVWALDEVFAAINVIPSCITRSQGHWGQQAYVCSSVFAAYREGFMESDELGQGRRLNIRQNSVVVV